MADTPRGLYGITPDGLTTADLLTRTAAALAGGMILLQYRDKSNDAARRLEQATRLLALCRKHGCRLIINDDLALALAIDADGVHLGGDDGDLVAARSALGTGKTLGASCYADFARAQAAARAGADYVAFGAVYPSPTKPLAQRAPLELITRARRELPHIQPNVQVAAIGGITLDNVAPVIAAGAHCTAVITDLFEAPDVTARAAAYQRLFAESAEHERLRHHA
ncbi:thiamine-phosphate synthase [Azospira sp. I13]|uniref:thiamine phosphate synthase n=1 Tax=Azospira sp. I13 TaxID=1765050 RepID=UPI000D4F7245|nr:thiamine phosphate synthase [Azospira sp. I13]GBG03347.1 thiamine-phosphate synthase [Azospira sp. I13]